MPYGPMWASTLDISTGWCEGLCRCTHYAPLLVGHRKLLRHIDVKGGKHTTIVAPGEKSEEASETIKQPEC